MGDSRDGAASAACAPATGLGRALLLTLVVGSVGACSPGADDPEAPGHDPDLPNWTLEAAALSAEATAPPLPVIVGLRTGTHDGYDRLTLELEDGSDQPGVRTRYIDSPVTECGSGRRVETVGEARIELRLEPAAAHTEAGAPTLDGREVPVDGEVLRHIYRTCNFEGIVTFVLALEDRRSHRVFRLDDPPRIVVDVRR